MMPYDPRQQLQIPQATPQSAATQQAQQPPDQMNQMNQPYQQPQGQQMAHPMGDAQRYSLINKGYRMADGGFVPSFITGAADSFDKADKKYPRNPANRQMQGAASQQAGKMPDTTSQYGQASDDDTDTNMPIPSPRPYGE